MKSYIKFGIFSALGAIFLSLINYVTGIEKMDAYRYLAFLGIIVPITFIYLGIKEKKEKELNGFITYGKAFNQGLRITMVSAAIQTVFMYFYFNYINPEIIDYNMQKALIRLQEQGMEDAQIEKTMGWMQMWMSPGVFTVTGLLMAVFAGVIISLIMAAILKNPDPEEIS